jgi:hypothetical protein
MSARARKALMRGGGIMLVILGMLHLAVTPIIANLVSDNVSPGGEWIKAPMILNHVVVAILLLPLGVLTFYAAPFAVLGEKWARFVTRATALTVAALPVILFVMMGSRYFDALPFLAATIIVSIAAVLLLIAAFSTRS